MTRTVLTKPMICEAAAAFRMAREAEANESLLAVVDALGHRLRTIPAEILAQLSLLMQKALDAQQRQDLVGVADTLEFEILPALQAGNLLADRSDEKRRS